MSKKQPEKKQLTMLTGRDDLSTVEAREFKEIPVEPWGKIIRIQSLTGAEQDEFSQFCANKRFKAKDGTPLNALGDVKGVRPKLAVLSIVDEEGKRIFHDSDMGRINALGAKGLSILALAILDFNGMGENAEEEDAENFSQAKQNGCGSE